MDDLRHKVDYLRRNPGYFVEEMLGGNLWEQQRLILHSVFNNRRTSVRSCHAIGKSYIAARAALAFLYLHPDSIVISTAPTYNQVVNILWREIRGAWERSKIDLGGEPPLTNRLEISPNWYALGFSTKDADKARGWHATSGHMLVIGDEASGIASDILDGFEGMMTTKDVHMLLIGNPTVSSGKFYESFSSGQCHNIKISAFMSPNFVANGINSIEDLEHITDPSVFETFAHPFPTLITPIWAWEKLQEWGRNSPLFQSLVCAEFPSQSADAVFSIADILKAQELDHTGEPLLRVMGVDVARKGTDKSVLCPLVKTTNGVQQLVGEWRTGFMTTETTGLALELATKIGWNKARDVFVVDDIGVGGAVTDQLTSKGYRVIAFNGASAGDEYHVNARDKAHYDLADAIRTEQVALLDFGEQTKQLSAIRMRPNPSGKRKVEGKDEMEKRGLSSPDFADALIMAWHGIQRGTTAQAIFTDTGRGGTITGGFLHQRF